MSILKQTDSYKFSHYLQYPPEAEFAHFYAEPRGISKSFEHLSKIPVVHFGLQMWIQKYLMNPITQEEIDIVDDRAKKHGVPFNRKGYEYILKGYNGYLPITIESYSEGTPFPIGIPQALVNNNDPSLFWLPGIIETSFLRALWYPSTVASISRAMKVEIAKRLWKTAGNIDGLEFMLHDFGARGVSSSESAEIGGLAHLVNFKGSDTFECLDMAEEYYFANTMPGFSIPAAEHSTITSWGRNNELGAYENMLTRFAKPNSVLAVVSDSYDLYHAVRTLWGEELKQIVIDSGATVVIRPDSGDPRQVVQDCLDMLSESFGFTVNRNGYRVLPKCIRLIQGDEVNTVTIPEICDNLVAKGWCISNLTFGMGGALLQSVNRDTFKYSYKMNALETSGGDIRPVFKEPIGAKWKKSRAGIFKVVDDFQVAGIDDIELRKNRMGPVYHMASYIAEPFTQKLTWDIVRKNAEIKESEYQ